MTLNNLAPETAAKLKTILGPKGFSEDPSDIAPYAEDVRRKFVGCSPLLLKPATTEEVSAILALCHETKTAIVPQGGNTGLVGGQIPTHGEVVLSLKRMNNIRAFDASNASMVLDAGVILEVAQQEAEKNGFILPLSMASKGSSTIGGMVSTNAGGVNVIRYGMAREQVLGLEVVLANGRTVDMLRTLRKNNTGYDLKQLFIGAEGTLGIVTGIALKLYPRPPARSTALLAIPNPDAALAILMRMQKETGSLLDAFEVFPREAVALVLNHIHGTVDPFAEPSPWHVLCEFSGANGIDEIAENLMGDLLEEGLATDAIVAASEAQRAALWKLRESMSDAERMEGPSFKHDVSVPVASVPAFISKAVAAVAAAMPDLRVVPYGHLGDGNIHFNILGAAPGPAFEKRTAEVARVVYDVVREFGGSFSAEHGVGLLKSDELLRYAHSSELALMRMLKQTLDPDNILNPGKLFGESDGGSLR